LIDDALLKTLVEVPRVNRTTVALPRILCSDEESFVFDMMYYYRNYSINVLEYQTGVAEFRKEYRKYENYVDEFGDTVNGTVVVFPPVHPVGMLPMLDVLEYTDHNSEDLLDSGR
jgi:hypothetical protein